MPVPEAHELPNFARELHGVFPQLEQYMVEIAIPRVQSAKSAECDDTILGLLIRATWNIGSVVRLDRPSDHQAVGACARSLFETMLDLALVTKEPASHVRVVAWEELQALKYARRMADSAREVRSGGAEIAQRFKDAREAEITARCVGLGLRSSSMRWTGRSVGDDARIVDAECPDAQLAAGSLASWQWTLLNWATHGSTLVGLRAIGMDARAALLATVRFTALHCGLACANLALKHAGHFDDLEVRAAGAAIFATLHNVLVKYYGQADVLAELLRPQG